MKLGHIGKKFRKLGDSSIVQGDKGEGNGTGIEYTAVSTAVTEVIELELS